MNNFLFFKLYGLAHQSIFFDQFIIFCADLLPYIVVIIAFAFLIYHHEVIKFGNPLKKLIQKWKEFFIVFFSGIFAWGVAEIIKILVHTDRPFIAFKNVYSLIPETGFSFPSQHATFFMAIAFGIFLSHKKMGYLFILFALIIGIARVIVGVHFPVDILAGFALGIIIASILYFIFKKIDNKKTANSI